MKIRICAVTFMFLFFGAGMAAADVMAGLGMDGVYEDSSSIAAAVAEVSVASTILSTAENAVYAALAGTAKLDPASSDRGFSGTAELLLSRLVGLDTAGIKFAVEGGQSDFTDTQWLTYGVSFPVTLNGETVSFTVTPQFEHAPLSGSYVSAGAGASLSFAVRELIVKPVLSLTSFWYDDGTRLYEAGPGIRVSWYPGFPLTTAVSTTFRYQTDPNATIADSLFETSLMAAASPFDWLLLSGEAEFSYPDTGFPSGVFIETSFFVHRNGVQSLSVPLHFRYTAEPVAVHEIGAGIRIFF